MNAPPRDVISQARLSDAERQAMLDRLDALEEKNPAKNKRILPRVAFRKNEIAVRIYHPGGSTSASFVTTRNLSAGGLSFLYQGFLHKNTVVEIVLKRRQGRDDVIRGSVQHCALVTRTIHLIGVRFDQKIFPKLYVDPTEWGELEDSTAIDPTRLEGNVLHLDEQEMDLMLMQHFLKGTHIKLTSCKTTDEAIEHLKSGSFDCVLCDFTSGGAVSVSVMQKIRAAGYAGPIALVTAETNPSEIKAAQDAGVSAVLSKPFDASKVASLLGTWLSAGTAGAEPIVSTLDPAGDMGKLVEQYVARLRVIGKEIRKQCDADNLDAVRSTCQAIRGTSSGFGFASLSEMAREAVESLDASKSISKSTIELQNLEAACFRAVAAKAA